MVVGVASSSTPSSYDVLPTTTCNGTTVRSRLRTVSGESIAVESVTRATVRDMTSRLSGMGIPSARSRLRRTYPTRPEWTCERSLMRVVIAGGHGQIALLLEKVLAERGDEPVGIVRNPDHTADV